MFPYMIGLAFGFGWTPCIGPILGSILALASIEETLSRALLLLSFYSLGLAIPFVLVTIAPRFIPAAEVNLFFLLETIIGPIWVWLIIQEQPSLETIQGGAVIITAIAIHSFIKLKNS